ncbi:cholecystokinin [Aplochiton taeniatus]
MNTGICACVLLAMLSSSTLGLPAQAFQPQQPLAQVHIQASQAVNPQSSSSQHTRQVRAAPPARPLSSFSKTEEEADPHTNLKELLARLIAQKAGYQRTSSLSSRASGPGPSHRIKDRDYLGWMDFGRRSAEEYEEYSS